MEQQAKKEEPKIPSCPKIWVKIKDLDLKVDEKQLILGQQCLNDLHIDAAQILVNVERGEEAYQSIHGHFYGFKPESKDSLQFHHNNSNHWVLSELKDGVVKVYDSLNSRRPMTDLV